MKAKNERPFRIGVLVSGRGSNLQALLNTIAEGTLDVQAAIVVSNRSGAPALARAAERGVRTAVFSRGNYSSRHEQQQAIADLLEECQIDLVVLAGFDQVLTSAFVSRFAERILNVHPSLLPAFGGSLHAQTEALAYGVKISGCTVHLVTEQVDAGPIVLQSAVRVLEDDTVDSLSARILEQEHTILPRAVALFAQRRVVVEGRRVLILPEHAPDAQIGV